LALLAGFVTVVALACLTAPNALATDSIYWTTPYNANKIYVAKLDGSSTAPFQTLNTGAATILEPWGLAIDPVAGKIYWSNYNFGGAAKKISWANLDGSGGGDLNTGAATVNEPIGVTIDKGADRIYWANWGGNKISWANLDGTGGGDLNTGTATVINPQGLALDKAAGKIYWANYGGNKISFAKLDNSGGGDLNIIGTTVNQPWGVTIDSVAGKIFWGNFQTNALDFANLDGIGGAVLPTAGAAQNGPMPGVIDRATEKIYWSNWNDGTIVFANVDGSGHGGTLYPNPAASSAMPVVLKSPVGTTAPTITAPSSTTPTTLSCSQGSWGADLAGESLFRAPRSFAYQWNLNGAPITGATSASLATGEAGSYTCSVTATNAAGSTTQTSALMGVTPPPPPPPPPPPVPYPRISIRTSGGWTVSNRGVTIVSMKIKGVPPGATLKLTCKACRIKQTVKARRNTVTLAKLRNRLLKRGQSFSVMVTKAGSIGDEITLTVKRYGHSRRDIDKAAAKPFTAKHRCVPVGAKKSAKTCAAHP
jgi:DNA-binding beta-propeller fold protein YncE